MSPNSRFTQHVCFRCGRSEILVGRFGHFAPHILTERLVARDESLLLLQHSPCPRCIHLSSNGRGKFSGAIEQIMVCFTCLRRSQNGFFEFFSLSSLTRNMEYAGKTILAIRDRRCPDDACAARARSLSLMGCGAHPSPYSARVI